MKKKSLFLNAVVILGLTAESMAQNSCDLINSLTLSAPETSIQLSGNQCYVSNVQGQEFEMPLKLNKWHYVAFTKSSPANSGVSTIYLDGKLIFTGVYMNNFYNWKKLILGHAFSDPWTGPYNIILPFKGYIDEVRISNIVRNAEEIQNTYLSNEPFEVDSKTIGLWHFDQNSGPTVSGDSGQNGQAENINWSQGVFGNCAEFNGVNSSIIFNQSLPSSNITCEFWIKPTSLTVSWPVSFDGSFVGGYTAGFVIDTTRQKKSYTWSTGQTGNTITVDPASLPYVWVSDGNCTDTIWFNSQSATVFDTTYISVTDTLLINTSVTGLFPPDNINTIKVFPNPASTHITIDYGQYVLMNGYQLRIENSLGQQVFYTSITQQTDYLDLGAWGGNGLYYVRIINPQGNTVDIKKIVLK